MPAAQESQFTITSCEGRHSKYLQGTKQGVLAVHAQKTQTLSPAQFQNYDCHIDIKMNMLKILFLVSGRFCLGGGVARKEPNLSIIMSIIIEVLVLK